MLVRKKTGDFRLCINYRELNKQLVRDNYPLPNTEDLIDHLGIDKTLETIMKSYWFSSMRQEIREHISNCLKCIAFSPSAGKKEGYLYS